MKSIKIKIIVFTFSLITTLFSPVFYVAPVSAHGGEDHGDEKPKTVSGEKGTITSTVRVGEFEIMLRHAPLEPDAAVTAKLFVTRYGTNEAVPDAQTAIEITAADGRSYEASEVKTDAAGSYGFKLPPLPEGAYTISARVKTAGETDTATFSGIEVLHHAHADSAASGSSSMQSALMILAAAVILGLFGGLIYFAARFGKSGSAGEKAVSV